MLFFSSLILFFFSGSKPFGGAWWFAGTFSRNVSCDHGRSDGLLYQVVLGLLQVLIIIMWSLNKTGL